MGCAKSSRTLEEGSKISRIRKPAPWRHIVPLSHDTLNTMREEFWDTAIRYGGQREIWDALRQVTETADIHMAQAIIEGAGIFFQTPDLSLCYDATGMGYQLPLFVLSEPTKMIQ